MADERLLPPGIRDERSLALLGLLDRFDGLDLSRLLVYAIDDVEASALPHLGWQFHVMGDEGWDLATSEQKRRSLIKRALELHRYKGTPWAVREAVKALGYRDVGIREGLPAVRHNGEMTRNGAQAYAGDRRWALFQVTVDLGAGEGLDAATIGHIRSVVEQYKNARSHLHSIGFRANVTVAGRPAADAVGLRAGLRLRSSQGVRDGRYRRGSAERHRRDGTLTYSGAVGRADRIVTAEIAYAVGRLWQTQCLHAGLRLVARRPALLPRDGVLTFAGNARRGTPVAVTRTGGLAP